MVVKAGLERDFLTPGSDPESAAHGLADSVDQLIEDGPPEANVACQDQIAGHINNRHRTFELHADPRQVGSRSQNEIIFELRLRAVVDQVDPRIDSLSMGLGVGRNVGGPFAAAAHQIVCDTG